MKNGDAQANVIYRGFISYSHNDSATARMIHRRLEAYRLPARLVGKDTPRGAVPARLTPIFRDREELSAGESLSDQVQAALAASACLIILCSPCAKASPWVAREIEMFRTLYPDRPVLAALIAGEPNEAFPQALTAGGLEPIAADFRKGGDGTRLALLKLVAGITATSLDALVQRDAQRQYRRVMAITFGAGVALLAMSALLVMAVRAQNEAQAQRQQAEGLVEYMLTDLRDRLKGVGRLDVMSAVNERAMAYYGAQGRLDRLPAESLDRRARILHAMGEDDEKRGDLDKALEKFTEAHRTTAAVLAKRPNDPEAIFAHAQSEYWIGYIDYLRHDSRSAKPRFIRYKLFADRLVQLNSSNPKWLRESSYAEGTLCSLALENPQDIRLAISTCGAALARMITVRHLLPNDTKVSEDLANRHAWVADAYRANRSLHQALHHRIMQRNLITELRNIDPIDASVRERWALAEYSLAEILHELGQNIEAKNILNNAHKEIENLILLDTNNLQLKKWEAKIVDLLNIL